MLLSNARQCHLGVQVGTTVGTVVRSRGAAGVERSQGQRGVGDPHGSPSFAELWGARCCEPQLPSRGAVDVAGGKL